LIDRASVAAPIVSTTDDQAYDIPCGTAAFFGTPVSVEPLGGER
jgi:hypothetical protein